MRGANIKIAVEGRGKVPILSHHSRLLLISCSFVCENSELYLLAPLKIVEACPPFSNLTYQTIHRDSLFPSPLYAREGQPR